MSSIKLKQRTGSIKLKERSGSIKLKQRTGSIKLDPPNFNEIYVPPTISAILTIDYTKIGEDLTDFPTYVDLADMPQAWWNKVKADGGDIRVFRDKKPLAREVVSIDKATQTGELHFKYDELLASQDRAIEIKVNGQSNEPAPDSPIGSQAVWGNGYQAVYQMEKGDIIDSTVNGNDGTNNGSSAATGKIGKARSFDGNSYIIVPYDGSLNSPASYTLSAVAKPAVDGDTSRDSFIFDIGFYAGRGYGIITGSRYGGNWGTYYNNNLMQGTTVASAGMWAWIDVTYDGSNVRLYINGSLEATQASHQTTIRPHPLRIGTEAKADERYFNGDIDKVRFASLARSDGWISTEYANQNDPSSFYTVSEGG